ncbi:phosphatase PAP2 family protein [Mycoplasmatota bacterium]|nr:phosphatase PAP2 family protein [Mycoplasmatota bacterium]
MISFYIIIAIVIIGGIILITNLDYSILDFIQKILASPFMDKVMEFFTILGDHGMVWVIICAILLISPKTRYISLVALVALLFSLIFNDQILKNIIQRDRPFVGLEDIQLLIKAPSSYSFPSGHTCSSFAAAFVFGKYFKKPYSIITYILASLIAFSRLYLYVHFPSDVIVGCLMGFICSFLAILLFNQYKVYQERKLLKKTNNK